MAMMINQRLKEGQDEEDDGVERIDLDALKKLDQKTVNPLKPYTEESVDKTVDK